MIKNWVEEMTEVTNCPEIRTFNLSGEKAMKATHSDSLSEDVVKMNTELRRRIVYTHKALTLLLIPDL